MKELERGPTRENSNARNARVPSSMDKASNVSAVESPIHPAQVLDSAKDP